MHVAKVQERGNISAIHLLVYRENTLGQCGQVTYFNMLYSLSFPLDSN